MEKIDICIPVLERDFPWIEVDEYVADQVRDLFAALRQLRDEIEELRAGKGRTVVRMREEIKELRAQVARMGEFVEAVRQTGMCKAALKRLDEAAKTK